MAESPGQSDKLLQVLLRSSDPPRLERMQWLLDCTESLQEEDVQELLKSWCGTLGQAAGPRLKGSRIKTHVSHSFSGFPGAEIHIGGKPAVPKLLRKDVADSHSEKKLRVRSSCFIPCYWYTQTLKE